MKTRTRTSRARGARPTEKTTTATTKTSSVADAQPPNNISVVPSSPSHGGPDTSSPQPASPVSPAVTSSQVGDDMDVTSSMMTNVFDLGSFDGFCYRIYKPVGCAQMKRLGNGLPLYRRVKYVSHGVDIAVVATRAAAAEVREKKLGLVGIVRNQDEEEKVVVWNREEALLSGEEDRWNEVDTLLRGFFTATGQGKWENGLEDWVLESLLMAVRQELILVLERKGWVQVGEQVILPVAIAPSMALKIDTAVASTSNRTLCAKIGVSKALVRRLRDDEEGVEAIISPTGLMGSIMKSRLAGSSLETSVRRRWYECGLLTSFNPHMTSLAPTGEVLFVQLDKGLNIPVPKERILAVAGKYSLGSEKRIKAESALNATSTTPTKVEPVEWEPKSNSRKRPRSPSPVKEQVRRESGYWKYRNAAHHVPTVPTSAFWDAERLGPSADSINAAISAAEQRTSWNQAEETSPAVPEPVKPPVASPLLNVSPQYGQAEASQQKAAPEPELDGFMDFTALEDDITSFFDNLGPETDKDQEGDNANTTSPMEIDSGSSSAPVSAPGPTDIKTLEEAPSVSTPSTPKLDTDLQKYYEDDLMKRISASLRGAGPFPAPKERTLIQLEKLRATKLKRRTFSHTLKTRRYTPARRIRRYLRSRRSYLPSFSKVGLNNSDSELDDDEDRQESIRENRSAIKTKGDGDRLKVESNVANCAHADEILDKHAASFMHPARDAASSVAVDCASASYVLVMQTLSLKDKMRLRNATSGISSSPGETGETKQDVGLQNFTPLHGILEMMTVAAMGASHCGLFDVRECFYRQGRLFSPASSLLTRRTLCTIPTLLKNDSSLQNKAKVGILRTSLDAVRPLSLQLAYGSGSIEAASSTRVCVGRDGDWLETSPRALPFWEKCRLEPYSGQKNLRYMALVPDSCKEDATSFFKDLSIMYRDLSLGQHTPYTDDAISVIKSSGGRDEDSSSLAFGNGLTEADQKMIFQYELSGKALVSSLCAILRSGKYRKNHSENGTCAEDTQSQMVHVVIYVVSPFPVSSAKCNAALVRALSPQLLCSSLMQSIAPGAVLNKAPYRDLPAAAVSPVSLNSATIRFVPHEICSASPSICGSRIYFSPLRPQLLKSAAVGTYNAVRTQRLRPAEPLPRMQHTGVVPNEMLSPLTPDMAEGSLYHRQFQQLTNKSTSQRKDHLPSQTESMIQELTGGWKYSPAIVLADQQARGDNARTSVALHLGYGWSGKTSRWIYSWCDDRGEMLDVSSVSGTSCRTGRRNVFSYIWDKARRWMNDNIEIRSITIAKLLQEAGEGDVSDMCEEEVEDWHTVVQRAVVESKLRHWKSRSNSLPLSSTAVEQEANTGKEGETVMMESLIEATTPVEGEDVGESSVQITSPDASQELSPQIPGLTHGSTLRMNSINVISVREDLSLMLLSSTQHAPYGNFIVTTESHSGPKCFIPAICGAGEGGVGHGFSLDLKAQYGLKAQCGREILGGIAREYVKLKTLTGRPCWPRQMYQGNHPMHLDCVAKLKALLEAVLG